MTVLISAVMALLAVMTVATAGLGVVYAARAQAQNAADASALAAAVATYPDAADRSPRASARMAAAANEARLVSCRCPVDPSVEARVARVVTEVAVEVPVFGELEVRAAARAEFDPLLWLGP